MSIGNRLREPAGIGLLIAFTVFVGVLINDAILNQHLRQQHYADSTEHYSQECPDKSSEVISPEMLAECEKIGQQPKWWDAEDLPNVFGGSAGLKSERRLISYFSATPSSASINARCAASLFKRFLCVNSRNTQTRRWRSRFSLMWRSRRNSSRASANKASVLPCRTRSALRRYFSGVHLQPTILL